MFTIFVNHFLTIVSKCGKVSKWLMSDYFFFCWSELMRDYFCWLHVIIQQILLFVEFRKLERSQTYFYWIMLIQLGWSWAVVFMLSSSLKLKLKGTITTHLLIEYVLNKLQAVDTHGHVAKYHIILIRVSREHSLLLILRKFFNRRYADLVQKEKRSGHGHKILGKYQLPCHASTLHTHLPRSFKTTSDQKRLYCETSPPTQTMSHYTH